MGWKEEIFEKVSVRKGCRNKGGNENEGED